MVGIDAGAVLAFLGALLTLLGQLLYKAYTKTVDGKAEDGEVDAVGEQLDRLEDELGEVSESARQTRRLAEASYAAVYGDENRPEDDGVISDHSHRLEVLRERVSMLETEVENLDRMIRRQQHRVETTRRAGDPEDPERWRGDGDRD